MKQIKKYTKENFPLCSNPEHNPPSHIVLDPGIYEHTCPSCGKTEQFEVPLVTC